MTLSEVYTRLKSTKLPVAYRAFRNHQAPPFIVYLSEGDNNFAADGRVYAVAHQVRIELYTQNIDTIAETAVEAAFSDIFYTKSRVFIDSEGVYETIYEMEA